MRYLSARSSAHQSRSLPKCTIVTKGSRFALQNSSNSIAGKLMPSERTTSAGDRARSISSTACVVGPTRRDRSRRQGCSRQEYQVGRSHRSAPCACRSSIRGCSGENSVMLADTAKPRDKRARADCVHSSSAPLQGSLFGVVMKAILPEAGMAFVRSVSRDTGRDARWLRNCGPSVEACRVAPIE